MDYLRHYFHIIHKAANIYATRNAGAEGLNPTEIDLIRHLVTQGQRNQQAIAEYLQIDKAAVTRALRRLEKNGYVERLPDESDARTKQVMATDRGINIRGDAAIAEDHFYDWLLESLTQEDFEIFNRVMQALYTRANEALQNRFSFIPPVEDKKG